MIKYKICIGFLLLFALLFNGKLHSQNVTEELTFDEVILLARQQSPDAIMAKHRFRANY